ncbi:UNVERIFIED_ORG: hypothetical protein J2Y81_001957 [Paraburkholderia sediminicola]|nr:hypothetical protein [Paraburkholderia sediminicola]
MDLVDTLKKKIEVLDDGDYIPGLRAVLRHIETAFRHLSRGQEIDDETAFTDAIYRTNQAFEGSIKEAYRVLAGQDPHKKRPFDIENYLEKKEIFRSRVLSQFTTYRMEWRNPSTHDYRLDFDESEAFLAIVSVSAFACLLFDQIGERLSFLKSKAEAESQKQILSQTLAASVNTDLLSRLLRVFQQYCATYVASTGLSTEHTEVQVVGALHGFLSAAAPDLFVVTEAKLDQERPFRADLLISRGDEQVVVEVKRRMVKGYVRNAIAQVERYMLLGGVKSGIVLFLPDAPGELAIETLHVGGVDGRIAVLSPEGSNLSLK